MWASSLFTCLPLSPNGQITLIVLDLGECLPMGVDISIEWRHFKAIVTSAVKLQTDVAALDAQDEANGGRMMAPSLLSELSLGLSTCPNLRDSKPVHALAN